MSTHALANVNFFDLCIVIAQTSLRGNCCLSCEEPEESDLFVSDIMGTHLAHCSLRRVRSHAHSQEHT